MSVTATIEQEGIALEKPIEAVFANILDLLEYSREESDGRVLHIGQLKNGGSFCVSYAATDGSDPDIRVAGQCRVSESHESAERVSLYVRSKLP